MKRTEHYSCHTELAKHLAMLSNRELASYEEHSDPRVRLAAAGAHSGCWTEVRSRLAARRLDDPELLSELRHWLEMASSTEAGERHWTSVEELLEQAAMAQDLLVIAGCDPSPMSKSFHAIFVGRRPGSQGQVDFLGWYVRFGKGDRSAYFRNSLRNTPAGWTLHLESSEPLTRGDRVRKSDKEGLVDISCWEKRS